MILGIVGWRGMVGSVLMKRMRQENDFDGLKPVFFSTSQNGHDGPVEALGEPLQDAFSLKELSKCDVIISCQGGHYTERIYYKLRGYPWNGIWIDAASTLRLDKSSLIVLDPVNRERIEEFVNNGGRLFVGGNCTVSLMLMAVAGLINTELVEWISSTTFQAASGAGAAQMRELIAQMHALGAIDLNKEDDVLLLDQAVKYTQNDPKFPIQSIGFPLAGSLVPWIDKVVEAGQTREEWKAMVECNKILGRDDDQLPIDGTCVRIGAMRCHSQALTIKLKEKLTVKQIEGYIKSGTSWTKLVSNTEFDTKAQLTPASVSGTLDIAVGRVRHLCMGEDFVNLFTVGDQLLWGAAEPLRRMLNIIRKKI